MPSLLLWTRPPHPHTAHHRGRAQARPRPLRPTAPASAWPRTERDRTCEAPPLSSHTTLTNIYCRTRAFDTPPRETFRKDRPDRWNLEGGTVPSAGARFNLNLTLSLLRYDCRRVTLSLRNGNTLVTGLFLRA